MAAAHRILGPGRTLMAPKALGSDLQVRCTYKHIHVHTATHVYMCTHTVMLTHSGNTTETHVCILMGTDMHKW